MYDVYPHLPTDPVSGGAGIGDVAWQSAARIVSGADAIISETLHIKGMTTHGGNHKWRMNRSMTHNVRGEFRRKLAQRCEVQGIPLLGVPGMVHQ